MYHSGVTIVHMIDSKLNVYFLVRVKYERFKLDDLTLVFCPRRNVPELMSSFLKRETYSELKALREFFCLIVSEIK